MSEIRSMHGLFRKHGGWKPVLPLTLRDSPYASPISCRSHSFISAVGS
jgi:hypothetical protein